MKTLSIEQACNFVRTALDELQNAGGGAMLASPDSLDIYMHVERTLEQAAVRIHLAAPAYMLDGVEGKLGVDFDAKKDGDVAVVTMKNKTVRVASVQMADSLMPVAELVGEDSAEGRMQLDKHIQGTPDAPVAVIQKRKAGEWLPVVKYYTTKVSRLEDNGVALEYVPYPELDDDAVQVCPQLEYAVLNELAAMVMENLSMADKAAVYRTRATEYLK